MMLSQSKIGMIYALGGGWGHLTRALSLGRIAARCHSVNILTNSPYAAYLHNSSCNLRVISADAGFSATVSQVRNVLLNSHYDYLIVDTFPRGLGGELADILPRLKHIPRILIHRDINPEYVRVKSLHSFVAEHFDAVIVPGEGRDLPLADLSIVQHTAPWLIRNADELPDKTKARSLLGLDAQVINNLCDSKIGQDRLTLPLQNATTILVCAAGQDSELSFFAQLITQLVGAFPTAEVRLLAAKCPAECPSDLWISHSPGIECLVAADVVVGGAGYNTVYECAALGVPLVAFAFKRLYDRQHRRASQSTYFVQSFEEAIITVQMLLDNIKNRICREENSSSFINGAVQAVGLIEKMLIS